LEGCFGISPLGWLSIVPLSFFFFLFHLLPMSDSHTSPSSAQNTFDSNRYIKIFLPFPYNPFECSGECVWAEKLTNCHARIDNHPIGKDVHGVQYNDVVKFESSTVPTSAPFQIAFPPS
jgi:hypothetical protein